MEEIKTLKETINLVQKSGTYNYKLIIPTEVEKKIRFACQKVWNTEWSGTLFFTYEGSFENNDLVIKCVDIYIMDIGTQAYTEFDMNPDVISYMCSKPELLDCQMGLIHSHNNMATFFSGTDTATLKEEGRDRNNFVSLIVNNAGSYTAAITRRIKSKQVKESISYEFFGEGEKTNIREYTNDIDEIEWFYLKVEKEGADCSFPDMDARLEEIKKQKEEKARKAKAAIPMYNGYIGGYNKATQKSDWMSSPSSRIELSNFNKGKGKGEKEQYNQRSLFDDIEKEELVPADSIPYSEIQVNPGIIESLVRQLVTCSIIIPNESKVDIDKWVKNMVTIYEKRFGKGEENIKNFKDWADVYTEFLTWNIDDKDLKALGYDQTDIQSIYAYDLIEALEKLPKNDYLNVYIEELEKYLML